MRHLVADEINVTKNFNFLKIAIFSNNVLVYMYNVFSIRSYLSWNSAYDWSSIISSVINFDCSFDRNEELSQINVLCCQGNISAILECTECFSANIKSIELINLEKVSKTCQWLTPQHLHIMLMFCCLSMSSGHLSHSGDIFDLDKSSSFLNPMLKCHSTV